MNILTFYDIEVFKHDALVVFKNRDKETIKIFHNDFTGLEEFIKDRVLVGYNNYHYDDIILSKMCSGWSNHQIKRLNDQIINGEALNKSTLKCKSLDCYQEISVNRPSLKYIEGNLGRNIMESSVPFDIDRPLTDKELEETIKYCSYDVDNTIDIYNMREKSYFKTKEMLVDKLGNKQAMKWNTTTISAQLLLDKPLNKWSSLRGVEKFKNIVPGEVWEMWQQMSDIKNKNDNKLTKSITINEFNNNIVFGSGGLHGVPKGAIKVENVILLDVASEYPHAIINIGALGVHTEKYKEILKKRIAIKHIYKAESDALKLILNSVYGNLKNKYSLLYNPNASLSVCVYGQIAMYDLCKRLAPTCKIVNINTDGVAFTTDSEEYKRIWKEWEKDYNFTLEEDRFDVLIQRDVNNYIGVKGDYIKCKGGDVSRYGNDKPFANNSARIIDIAIVEYLVNGKSITKTLVDNLDKPYLFQFILKAGSTYEGTFDKEGNQYQKVNRVFATRDGELTLYKKRADGGLVKFADTPDKMFLWNGACNDIDNFEEIIDLDYYYQLINKKLEAWNVY